MPKAKPDHAHTIDEQARRLRTIAAIIELVDLRCMAADGPVSDTREEMTADEMRQIYRLATGTHKARDLFRTAPGGA